MSNIKNPTKVKDLIKITLPKNDLYFIHDTIDIGFAPVGGLSENTLTPEGAEAWSDILDAGITKIQKGAYGLEIALTNVEPERITDFSFMLVGQCSQEDYNRWVTQDKGTKQFGLAQM